MSVTSAINQPLAKIPPAKRSHVWTCGWLLVITSAFPCQAAFRFKPGPTHPEPPIETGISDRFAIRSGYALNSPPSKGDPPARSALALHQWRPPTAAGQPASPAGTLRPLIHTGWQKQSGSARSRLTKEGGDERFGIKTSARTPPANADRSRPNRVANASGNSCFFRNTGAVASRPCGDQGPH